VENKAKNQKKRQTDREIQIVYVNAGLIQPSPHQPRKYFDPISLDELKMSIEAHGILQPLIVRKNGNRFELLAGERRLRAAKLAGLSEIPVIVKEISEQEAAAVTLVENLQRDDISFFEEASGYERLANEFGLTQNDIARLVGRSQSAVANKLRLLKLPEEIKEIISREILSERHARALVRLPDSKLQQKALSDIVADNLNARQTDELVDDLLSGIGSSHASKKLKKRIMVIRDIRIFLNTIKAAIKAMHASGIGAEWEELDTEEATEFRIIVPKKSIELKKMKKTPNSQK
jgi:ParB family chromosome partitioning protein